MWVEILIVLILKWRHVFWKNCVIYLFIVIPKSSKRKQKYLMRFEDITDDIIKGDNNRHLQYALEFIQILVKCSKWNFQRQTRSCQRFLNRNENTWLLNLSFHFTKFLTSKLLYQYYLQLNIVRNLNLVKNNNIFFPITEKLNIKLHLKNAIVFISNKAQ